MKPIKTFLDSSVIIAGLASQSGGSHKLLVLVELKIIKAFVSEYVVSEVYHNIEKKMPDLIDKTYLLFSRLPFVLIDPDHGSLKFAESMINAKDAPVLAAAVSGNVDWLITLDRHFLNQPWQNRLKFDLGTPGQFLANFFS